MAKDNPPKVRQHQGGLFFHYIASFMKLSKKMSVNTKSANAFCLDDIFPPF